MIQFWPSEAQDLDPQHYVQAEQPTEAILCGASSTSSVPSSSTKQSSSPHCLWGLLQVWPGGPLFSRVSPESASGPEFSTTCRRQQQQQQQSWQAFPEGLRPQACPSRHSWTCESNCRRRD